MSLTILLIGPRRVLAVVALATVSILAGCGGSTVASGPTLSIPTPPTGFSTYRSPDGVFGLDYPSQWGVSLQLGERVIGNSANHEIFGVLDNQGVVSSSSQYVTNAQGFAQNFLTATNVTITSGPIQKTIGRYTWTLVSATLSVDGVALTMSQYETNANGKGVYIDHVAPSAIFASAYQSYFLPMMNTFTIF